MCRNGKLLCILFKLPRRIQHPLDDSADLAAEILDEVIEVRLAPFRRHLFSIDAFGLELAAFDAVVLENIDGSGDRPDFVVATRMTDFDVCASLGEAGQRFRHSFQRLGDAADNQHRHREHQQSGDGRSNGNGPDRLPQHGVELRRRNADIDDADHLAASTEHRLIRGIETTSKQDRRAFVGFAAAEYGLRGMISRKLRADRPVAIFFLQIRGAANKLLRRLVIHEERGGAADIRGGPIHNPVIAEFRHLRNFNAVNDADSNCDLRVREGFGKRETERAEVDIDIALRAGIEVARQRPVPGSHHQRSIDSDQDGRANAGLWPEVKPQESEAVSLKSNRHEALSENQLNVRTYWISFTIRLN